MNYILQYISWIVGGIPGLIMLAGILFSYRYERKEKYFTYTENDFLKKRIKDLQIVFIVTFLFLIINGTFQFIEIEKNKEQIEKTQKERDILKEKNNILLDFSSRLETKNKEYCDYINQTKAELVSSMQETRQITDDIAQNIYTCLNYLKELVRLNDTTVIILNKFKQEFHNDTLQLSNEQINYYINTIEILKINLSNSRRFFFYMRDNLIVIIRTATQMRIKNSRRVLYRMEQYDFSDMSPLYNVYY